MGLDITTYINIKPADNPQYDDYGELDYGLYWAPGRHGKWSEMAFPGRAAGVDLDAVYSFEKRLDFRAGSYGGYNAWRDQLAQMAGYLSPRSANDDGPFAELIHFAYNEGVIGPIIAGKLYRDFKANSENAERYASELGDDWFLAKYNDWMNAFEAAAQNGAVEFH